MPKPLSEQEFRRIVKEGCQDALRSVGIDVDNPLDVQADMKHIRDLRKGCEATKRNILKVFIMTTLPSGFYLLWEALKGGLKQ